MENIVCFKNAQTGEVRHYQLTDPNWTLERLRDDFMQNHLTGFGRACGIKGESARRFLKHVEDHGGKRLDLPTMEFPA